jgi:hypothetical protein
LACGFAQFPKGCRLDHSANNLVSTATSQRRGPPRSDIDEMKRSDTSRPRNRQKYGSRAVIIFTGKRLGMSGRDVGTLVEFWMTGPSW